MKYILLLSIALLALSANAQQAPADSTLRSVNLRMNTAGATLQKGSSQLITGSLMTIAGAALIAAGGNDQKPLIYIGAATSVIGVGFTFSGFGKIGKAGRELQNANY